MNGRKWKLDEQKAENIREYLLKMGGEEEKVKNISEKWRVRFSDSTFTFYSTGTLYSTPSNSRDPAVENVWNYIDSIVGSLFIQPTKEFLIGFDETGKGELIGHMHLVGVIIPNILFSELERIISTADTKKKHNFDYWDTIFRQIANFQNKGLKFIEEKIPPWDIDRYNINKIMDVVYQRILNTFFRDIPIEKCRIVIDDYGIGDNLKRFLNFLKQIGAEIVVSQKADDKYLEVRISSLIAKRNREMVIKTINEKEEFKIENLSIGSGNAGNRQTIEWLEKWYKSGKDWPWFIRRSFSSVREIEGKKEEIRKEIPPIDENLLTEDFKQQFNSGKLDIRALSVVCPHCGTASRSVQLINKEDRFIPKCHSCNNTIENLDFTLRYYCGFIIPDSNIINRGLISKALDKKSFFDDFTILIPGIVRFECDTPGGKKEFERLGRFASIGRIKLEEVGESKSAEFKKLTSQEKDDLIMNLCIEYNAILITADNQVKALAVSRKVFTIFV